MPRMPLSCSSGHCPNRPFDLRDLLGTLSYKLGRSVTWDGAKATCIGDPDANGLLGHN